jgi:hypothetical protein
MTADIVAQATEGDWTFTVGFDDGWHCNPREWENLGTLIGWHRSFGSPDACEFATPQEFRAWWADNGAGGMCLPVFMLDHGGQAFSVHDFNDSWDSGQFGVIYATAERIAKMGYGPDEPELIKSTLAEEVEVFNQWQQGLIYYWSFSKTTECPSCGHSESVEGDCSYGYIGSIDYGDIYCGTVDDATFRKLVGEVARSSNLIAHAPLALIIEDVPA